MHVCVCLYSVWPVAAFVPHVCAWCVCDHCVCVFAMRAVLFWVDVFVCQRGGFAMCVCVICVSCVCL